MFLRRMAISLPVLAVLTLVGLLGEEAFMTKDRHELAYNTRNLVRLHIVANSDRAADQRIKERVRDAVLAETRRLFMDRRDPDEVVALARANLGPLRDLVERVIRASGADYGARIEVGRFAFPARLYPFGTLPAGEYRAVRIVLGRGRGKNWWCVLFPPLCFMTEGETTRPIGTGRVRLLFLERLLRRHGQAMDGFWRGWARFFGIAPSPDSGSG